jgi:hypothetical protein
MRDLRVGRLCAFRKVSTAQQANHGDRRAQSNEHVLTLLWRRDSMPPGIVDGTQDWMARERKGS